MPCSRPGSDASQWWWPVQLSMLLNSSKCCHPTVLRCMCAMDHGNKSITGITTSNFLQNVCCECINNNFHSKVKIVFSASHVAFECMLLFWNKASSEFVHFLKACFQKKKKIVPFKTTEAPASLHLLLLHLFVWHQSEPFFLFGTCKPPKAYLCWTTAECDTSWVLQSVGGKEFSFH